MTDKHAVANKALVRRFYNEVYVDWNMVLADEVVSPKFRSDDWPEDGPTGPKAFRDYYSAFRSVVPDARYEVDDLIAENDRVVVRWRMLGTHKGEFQGIGPTGKAIVLQGIAIYRLDDGKLIERWVVSDVHGVLEQIRRTSTPKRHDDACMKMGKATVPNSRTAIDGQRAAGILTWPGPALMLFARSAFAVVAQGLVAGIYAMHGSAAPWRDAGAWLPVYGSLIDAGCLCLLWWLTRREGIRLVDLLDFDRGRLWRDVLLGLALIPACLVFILGGIFASNLLVYGSLGHLQLNEPLPLLPAVYSVLVWPLVWGITEQMTYNGYLLPRFQVLSGSTAIAVGIVGFSWVFQHVVMPLMFEPHHMAFRFLSSLPNALFFIVVYLRLRRLLPLVIAHSLLDGASAFLGSLLPLLR